jgi:hypothetical protein
MFSIFCSRKSENRKAEQVLPKGEGWHHWEGEVLGEESEYGAIKCVFM